MQKFLLGLVFVGKQLPRKSNPWKFVLMKDELQQLQWATLNHENSFSHENLTHEYCGREYFCVYGTWCDRGAGRVN